MKFRDALQSVGGPSEAARRQVQAEAEQVRAPVVQRSPYVFFRIVANESGTTTTTTPTTTTTLPPGQSTTTTTTTSTTTTTTTQPPCSGRLWFGVAVEVQYDDTPTLGPYGWRKLVVLPRDDNQTYPLLSSLSLELQIDDIAIAVFQNGRYWILGVYTNCPQANVTTTTTTTTTTTSSTSPPPRVWRRG